ncbi:MAG: hypothetical protein ACHQNA_00325 [Acidimicrobiales bacterium]
MTDLAHGSGARSSTSPAAGEERGAERPAGQPHIPEADNHRGAVAVFAGIAANVLGLLATGIAAAAIRNDASSWPHGADLAGLAGLVFVVVAIVAGRVALRLDPESGPGLTGLLLGAAALAADLYAFPVLFLWFVLKGADGLW